MSRVTRVLDDMSDEELEEFEKDLKTGLLQRFIEQKKEYFRIKDKACSVCGNNIDEDCLVLIFGDPRIGIRKKAHFCGHDCLEYFINKNIKRHPKASGSIKDK